MCARQKFSRRAVVSLSVALTAASLSFVQILQAGLIAQGTPGEFVAKADNVANLANQPEEANGDKPLDANSGNAPEGTPDLPLSASTNLPQLAVSATGIGADSSPGLGGVSPNKRNRKNSSMSRPGTPGNGSGGSGSRSGFGANGGANGPNSLGTGSGGGASGAGANGSGSAADSSSGPAAFAQTAFASSGGSSGTSDSGVSANSAAAPGASADNPILPSSTNDGSYVFNYKSSAGGNSVYFDPPIAPGYAFTTSSGSPNFASFTIDTPLPGTTDLTISFDNLTEHFSPTSTFDFTAYVPGGVSEFTVTGISRSDVNSGGEFNYHMTFVDSTQNGSFSQTALFENPEPGSITLVIAGVLSLFGWRRTRGNREVA